MRSWGLRFRASLERLPPEQVALLLAVGLVLGVFPIMGFPTLFCVLAAFGLRLNLVALQLLNNISSPLQFALLVPFARAGAWLCGGPAAGHSAAGMLGLAAWHAVAGWVCICIPAGALLYVILVFALRRRRPPWLNGLESPA